MFTYFSLKDNRIVLTKLFVAIALFFSVVGIFIAGIPLMESMTLSLMFIVLAFTNFYGFYALKSDKPALLIFILLCLYVWIAFPLKLMFVVADPTISWLSYSFFAPDVIKKELPNAFVRVFPGLLLLFVGFYLFHSKSKPNHKINNVRINHILFISAIIGLMALRVFNQLVLNLGVPGVKPNVIDIPFITGILELLSRPVLMALVNMYLYYVLRLRYKKGIWIAFLLAVVNIILGLRVGYKSELVLQVILLVYYFYELSPYLSKTNRKIIPLSIFILSAFAIVIYPLVNNYRFYLLSGSDVASAIERSQTQSEIDHDSVALSFLNRVNGVDVFYAATKLGEGGEFGLESLLNRDVMELMKESLYGDDKDEAITAFGTTQFSVFYLVGGVVFLSISCFIIGWVIRWCSVYLRTKVFKLNYTYHAYLPLFCILCVKLLSSGGNILLYVKEMFLVVLCMVFMEKYGTSNRI